MNEHIVRFLNETSPSTYGLVTLDGTPIDLTGATVKFRMRPVLGSTLEVDKVVAITNASPPAATAAGHNVRYDPDAADVDTEGFYAAWWYVDPATDEPFSTPEFLFEIREHNAQGGEYITVPELKGTLSLDGKTFADADIASACASASAIIDDTVDAPFTAGAPGTVRYYTPVSEDYLIIDPTITITAVAFNGAAQVADTHYYQDGRVLRALSAKFPRNQPRSVAVTGTYGYATVPPRVKDAAKIIATQILMRTRQAPFGIVVTSLDGAPIRIGRFDPQVDALLADYTISSMIE